MDFAADLTILEEGTELLNRLVAWKEGKTDAKPIPMFTSCCPGWIGESYSNSPFPTARPVAHRFKTLYTELIELRFVPEELEKKHDTIIPNVSTCKSPQGMLGAVVKKYFAKKIGKKPEEVSFVSVMPCVRKQGESERPQNQTVEIGHDVDHVGNR